jgi:hypothetical protein
MCKNLNSSVHNSYVEVLEMVRDEIRDRLSLYISRDIVREAKRQKINISKITEEWLNAHTLIEKNDVNLNDAYSQLIRLIVPLLREYDSSIKIAESQQMAPIIDHGKEYEIQRPLNIFLMPDGSFYIDEDDRYFKDISVIAPSDFLSPEKILKNLVDALAENRKAMERKMREILMAKNIVYAIYKSLLETKPSSNSDTATSNREISSKDSPKNYRRKKYRS